MDKAVDTILRNIGWVLRYSIPGVVAAVVIWWLWPQALTIDELVHKPRIWWGIVLAAIALFGWLVYSLHKGVLFPCCHGILLIILRRRLKCPELTLLELDFERWRRRNSWKHPDHAAVQMYLDGWAHVTHALYCMGWVGIFLAFLTWWHYPDSIKNKHFWFVSIAGLAVLVVSIVNDWKETERELYLAKNHPLPKEYQQYPTGPDCAPNRATSPSRG